MVETTPPPLVDLSRDIEASPETVWKILTTPELFSTWLDGNVQFEGQVGSPFRAEFPNFQIVIAGSVVHLNPEARHLGVTWGMETGPHAETFPAGYSLVDFRVHETESGCRVELTHSQLPSEQAAREQEGGWTFHLSRMAVYANRSDLGVGLERTLEGWFSAWNEPDDTKRLEALRACCADDVVFRDDWAVADGVDLLSLHIANCFRFVPGWKLEATGDVRICRGEALVGWRSVGPDGASIEGSNHLSASHDGTLQRVTGFQAG
jgi:uncharacterized protein YndB with AHSA1/START domain